MSTTPLIVRRQNAQAVDVLSFYASHFPFLDVSREDDAYREKVIKGSLANVMLSLRHLADAVGLDWLELLAWLEDARTRDYSGEYEWIPASEYDRRDEWFPAHRPADGTAPASNEEGGNRS